MLRWFLHVTLILLFTSVMGPAGDNKWTTSGPFGGNFRRIVFHPTKPDIVFAKALAGFFRSTNGGKTWHRLSAPAFDGGVIAIHPDEPDTVISGSKPLFISFDRGVNWIKYSEPDDNLSDLIFHPGNSTILYGLGSGGVYKSTNTGRSFVAKNSGLDLSQSTARIVVDPKNGNILYVLVGTGKVFKSTNGADSWQLASNGLNLAPLLWISALAIDPKNSQILYAGADGRGVFKTTDGGNRWFDTDCNFSEISGPCNSYDIAVDPKNTNFIYSIGSSYLVRSTNGGSDWKLITGTGSLGGEAIAVHPGSTNVVLAGGDYGLLRSIDRGVRYKPTLNRLDALAVGYVIAHPIVANQLFAFGFPLGGSFVSNRTGKNFVLRRNVPPIADFQPGNANIAVSDLGWISINGGKTFEQRGAFFQNVCIACVKFSRSQPNTIYSPAIGSGDDNPPLGMVKTTDLGNTWKLINSGLADKNVQALAVAPSNGDIVYVGTFFGKVFKTINGGKSWKKMSSGLKTYRTNNTAGITTIAIHPTNPQIAYLSSFEVLDCCTSVVTSHIYKTTNGGKKWVEKRNGFPDRGFAIVHLAINPDNLEIWGAASALGTGTGTGAVFIYNDEDDEWRFADTVGLGNFGTSQVLFNKPNPRTTYLATDRGVFTFTLTTPQGRVTDPKLDGLNPQTAKIGDTISIKGSNFGNDEGSVNFPGIGATVPLTWSARRITVRVPEGSKNGQLTIETSSSATSNPVRFSLQPASGAIEPAVGKFGDPITIIDSLKVIQSNKNAFLLFGDVPVINEEISIVGDGVISCDAPRHDAGTVQVFAVGGAGQTLLGEFTYE